MARVELAFWKPEGAGTQWSVGFSTLAHVVIIAAWIGGTAPSEEPTQETALGRVLYLPPPNPEPERSGSAEAVRYVELAPDGLGAGAGVAEPTGVELAVQPMSSSPTVGNVGQDSLDAVARTGNEGADSVFTVIEVDSAAARLPESAAPRYPAELLEKRIQGQAIVQFVVDTNGRADVNSFSVVLASHPDFAQSVRDALPGMRFSSARIGALKVRQLVELPFSFNIATPPPDTTKPADTLTAQRRRRP
ncbi:MAG TPA: TonB family protein [Gemmatimonadaceae bacterium]|nr:TonB family protein [Gemmatimonadaceae bacterium]